MASKSFRTWRKFTTASTSVFKDFTDGSERMSYPEFCAMLENVDKGLRALPATAQVAKQEGQYLASFFNDCAATTNKSKPPREIRLRAQGIARLHR